MYERFCASLRDLGVAVETGVFGARMEVELVNDGPVTIVLEAGRRVKRVLLTGMSGTGKSSVVEELIARGYKAIDTDYGFCDVAAGRAPALARGRDRGAARDRGRRRPLRRRLRGEPGQIPPAVRPHRPPERSARDDGRAPADEDEQPVRQGAARVRPLPRRRERGRAAAAAGGRSRGSDDSAPGRGRGDDPASRRR